MNVTALFVTVLLLYAVVVAIYIILENRTPQSTFAWLLLFLAFPIGGLVIYRFAGRGWRAFSKENELARHELGSELLRDLGPVRARQHEYVERIARERPASFKRKLLRRLERSSNSMLAGFNEV